MDAVYAMAHALHNLIVDVCGKEGKICSAISSSPMGINLLKYIRNVSFTSKSDFGALNLTRICLDSVKTLTRFRLKYD